MKKPFVVLQFSDWTDRPETREARLDVMFATSTDIVEKVEKARAAKAYKAVARCWATDLDEVFDLGNRAQDEFIPFPSYVGGARGLNYSISVGDLIRDHRAGKTYVVAPVGFVELPDRAAPHVSEA